MILTWLALALAKQFTRLFSTKFASSDKLLVLACEAENIFNVCYYFVLKILFILWIERCFRVAYNCTLLLHSRAHRKRLSLIECQGWLIRRSKLGRRLNASLWKCIFKYLMRSTTRFKRRTPSSCYSDDCSHCALIVFHWLLNPISSERNDSS